jgi:hypothetical protein
VARATSALPPITRPAVTTVPTTTPASTIGRRRPVAAMASAPTSPTTAAPPSANSTARVSASAATSSSDARVVSMISPSPVAARRTASRWIERISPRNSSGASNARTRTPQSASGTYASTRPSIDGTTATRTSPSGVA